MNGLPVVIGIALFGIIVWRVQRPRYVRTSRMIVSSNFRPVFIIRPSRRQKEN